MEIDSFYRSFFDKQASELLWLSEESKNLLDEVVVVRTTHGRAYSRKKVQHLALIFFFSKKSANYFL